MSSINKNISVEDLKSFDSIKKVVDGDRDKRVVNSIYLSLLKSIEEDTGNAIQFLKILFEFVEEDKYDFVKLKPENITQFFDIMKNLIESNPFYYFSSLNGRLIGREYLIRFIERFLGDYIDVKIDDAPTYYRIVNEKSWFSFANNLILPLKDPELPRFSFNFDIILLVIVNRFLKMSGFENEAEELTSYFVNNIRETECCSEKFNSLSVEGKLMVEFILTKLESLVMDDLLKNIHPLKLIFDYIVDVILFLENFGGINKNITTFYFLINFFSLFSIKGVENFYLKSLRLIDIENGKRKFSREVLGSFLISTHILHYEDGVIYYYDLFRNRWNKFLPYVKLLLTKYLKDNNSERNVNEILNFIEILGKQYKQKTIKDFANDEWIFIPLKNGIFWFNLKSKEYEFILWIEHLLYTKGSVFFFNVIDYKFRGFNLNIENNPIYKLLLNVVDDKVFKVKKEVLIDIFVLGLLGENMLNLKRQVKNFFFIYGVSGTYKTTIFNNVLETIFGKNSIVNVRPIEGSNFRFDYINFKDKRFWVVDELKEKEKFDVSLIKSITGQSMMEGEKKFVQEKIKFTPYCVSVFISNELINMNGWDSAMFKRLYVIKTKKSKQKINLNFTKEEYEEFFNYLIYKLVNEFEKIIDFSQQKWEDKESVLNAHNKTQESMKLSFLELFLKRRCKITKKEFDFIPYHKFVEEYNKWIVEKVKEEYLNEKERKEMIKVLSLKKKQNKELTQIVKKYRLDIRNKHNSITKKVEKSIIGIQFK